MAPIDISLLTQYWGNLRPYADNAPSYFSVNDTGLPDGCQIEQVHVLHRHGARFPTGADVQPIQALTAKLSQIISAGGTFTGPLKFLNTWSLQLGTDVLVPNGAAMAYKSGVDFWNEYGRILYDSLPNQAYYNGSGRAKLLFRTTAIPRTYDTLTNWATGFFGPYNSTDEYSILPISYSSGSNNTLAGYVTCTPFTAPNLASSQYLNNLSDTVARISAFAPSFSNLTASDVRVMQLLCIYEYNVFDASDFCRLFTMKEWQDLDEEGNKAFYDSSSFGSPRGRAQGLGYVEELIARLTNKLINVSDSAVNSTLDSSETTFPLNQPFYTDMSHEFNILSVLTSLSIDYFRDNVTNGSPTSSGRHFQLSYMTPFASRLITEKIGCVSSTPSPTNDTRTQYSRSQYGYSAALATNKFIRMRLNNGILPLNTIRGGLCSQGRTDGLCPMDNFIASQKDAKILANYQYVCFANYTVDSNTFHNDGTISP